MADDFQGSIAQNNITFSISTSVSSVVGANYYTPMIFIGSGANATANIVTPPSTGSYITVNASNYSTLVQGTLLTWLTSFYGTGNSVTSIIIVVYDSTTALSVGLANAYNAQKALGYHKFIFESGTDSATKVAFAGLCAADPLLSFFMSGTTDTGAQSDPMTTGLVYEMNEATVPVDGYVVQSAQSGVDIALSALALAYANYNQTGTPVGNRIDYNRTSTLKASGTTGGSDNSNVSATAMTNLKKNKTAFMETVGNQTGAVAVVGDETVLGKYWGAEWFKNYFQYVCQVNCAQYLTDPTAPKYKNNATYQGILGMVKAAAQPFVELGILSNFKVTTAPFSSLPASAGNTIVIPNAWSADFNRGVSYVTVQGTLYISA
jgi:hypothetical protein